MAFETKKQLREQVAELKRECGLLITDVQVALMKEAAALNELDIARERITELEREEWRMRDNAYFARLGELVALDELERLKEENETLRDALEARGADLEADE